MKVISLVLASASPRRAELLRNAGIPFTVDVANISEEVAPGEPPAKYAERLAREKAEEAWPWARRVVRVRLQRCDGDLHPPVERQGAEESVELSSVSAR